ncbi:MAG: sigma-70 family RNA polymerase sigma factor [Leptolyngbyaceae cyanobacterium]
MSYSFSTPWTSAARSALSALRSDSPSQLSSYDLIQRCRDQRRPDKAAFAELVKRYQSYVERLLYHLAPDWSDRADLTQEVWIRVYRNLYKLQTVERFKSWLGRITTNLFYDELRKRKRHQSPLSLDAPRMLSDGEMEWEVPSDAPNPVDTLMTQEFYAELEQAIASLPEVFRTTIVLREIQGLSYEEIAEITNTSLGTVKSRIARARQRLQQELNLYLKTESLV